MDMRTQAPGVWSANSVAAKGAFARAGDEEITIEFEYMFIENPYEEAELVVYLSDDPEVSQNLVEVARIRSPNEPNQPGWIDSGQFAVFSDTFARSGLNFNRGTYIELELRGANTRCWIDNWDPVVRLANFVVVDDMESYTPGRASPNGIFKEWIDGVTNRTGSLIGLGIAPATPVHGGEQSMVYTYENTWPYYSEIQRVYTDPCDWTAVGVKALTLHFYGSPFNNATATDRMYVALEDSNGSYAEVRYGDNGEDMNDVKIEHWHEWSIDLQDFNDADVNLTEIKKVYIGFGNKADPFVPGGFGIVYFDDIYLYEPTCRPSLRSEAFAVVDLSGDCIVGLADLQIIAFQWLSIGRAAADLNDDKSVDFTDYALLADRWLETEGMWP
jgi:hypothetical protein